MKKFICFLLFIFFSPNAFGETYRSDHFIVYSDLDPRFIKCLQANIEAYYNNLAGKFFVNGWSKPLEIYYSKDNSETFKLLCKHGYKKPGSNIKNTWSYYIPDKQIVYTHPYFMRNGKFTGFGVLFHEITHHFVQVNYPNVPNWFNEGLATFLGDESSVVKGKVTLGVPNLWRDYRLKEQLDKNIFPDIRRLYMSKPKQFYNWPIGYHFSRAFFYWLYENGQLDAYLKNAKKDGYDISVLKNTLKKPVIEINKELLAFIKKDCYAGAYLYQSFLSNGQQKEQALLKSLELKPKYGRAIMTLASYYYREDNYEQTKHYLDLILSDPKNSEYERACESKAYYFFDQKNYQNALEYYQKTLEYADYDAYRYEIFYYISQCYDALKDSEKAKEFYAKYAAENWDKSKPKFVQKLTEYQNAEQQTEEPNSVEN